MRRYRKKPVVIEAVQLLPENSDMLYKHYKTTSKQWGYLDNGKLYCDINTLEGTMRAEEGDWIIKGVKGEFYPCKPDIFEATYEEVTDND